MQSGTLVTKIFLWADLGHLLCYPIVGTGAQLLGYKYMELLEESSLVILL